MNTYEITKDEIKDLEVLAEGYKAIKYDLSTKGDINFRYGEKGENLIGKIFKVDGEIEECTLGLHFSKDPAYVFNFYEPLSYNRYFKVRAYGNLVDSQDGFKTVAQIIEFVEEYDLMEFIEKIKEYDRTDSDINWSYGINCSDGINESYGVNRSNGIICSDGINCSNGINESYGVNRSNGINWSDGVNGSNGVNWSYGIRECTAISESLFCNKIKCKEHYLFNKKINKKRFNEVYGKILSFNYFPNFNNFYELKGNKEWWAVTFPELMTVDNKTAWSKMPKEMKEYIQGLPEYDEEIFKEIAEKE